MRTITIPPYTSTDEQVEDIRRESVARYGIPYAEAERNVRQTLTGFEQQTSLDMEVPPFEVVAL